MEVDIITESNMIQKETIRTEEEVKSKLEEVQHKDVLKTLEVEIVELDETQQDTISKEGISKENKFQAEDTRKEEKTKESEVREQTKPAKQSVKQHKFTHGISTQDIENLRNNLKSIEETKNNIT